ncbi:MAG TPA: MerR family transcriptional regulator [Chlamydiales bacterium]|nr:MerR family transcriptional regulator [Chlamydiales bacterium]
MAYTVKKISQLSGVTVRTLHFYEEAELLKPAYYGENGYRYYEEKELLLLQQILFFKELGLTLKRIRKILGRSDFDQLAALHSHRQALSKDWERMGVLIETIDKTIQHLNGQRKMKEEEMYNGFITKEKQAEYMAYLKNRLGADHPSFAECEKNSKNWTKEDWERSKKESDVTFKELSKLMEKQISPSSKEVQAIVLKLYQWIKKFWTPNKESFTALGQMYTEFEWKKFFEKYDPHHPRLAKFLAEGMKVFAETEL